MANQTTLKRREAYNNSVLPYSFTYKMKKVFCGKKCPICGYEMHYSYTSRVRMPTIQHNIPISKGGTHNIENISIICLSCNVSIRDKETNELNNKEVIYEWNKLCQK